MLLAVPTDGNTVEVNFMWLPSWLSFDQRTMTHLNELVAKELVGKELSTETLMHAHEVIVDAIKARFPHFAGLEDYLDAIKFVSVQ